MGTHGFIKLPHGRVALVSTPCSRVSKVTNLGGGWCGDQLVLARVGERLDRAAGHTGDTPTSLVEAVQAASA
jgi:hypothetical protein